MKEYFHIYCRGIEKKDIFLDHQDHDRFIQSLWIFNNYERTRFGLAVRENRKQIIDLLDFCLMPNHFHLLISINDPNETSKYMQKLMTAYTMYFKKKYRKSGRVFESVYRSKYIQDDTYLRHIIKYIHNNPLSLKYEDYRSKDLLSGLFTLSSEARKWLNKYPYSSRNYRKTRPPLTARPNLVH